jgi:hypothetical protein
MAKEGATRGSRGTKKPAEGSGRTTSSGGPSKGGGDKGGGSRSGTTHGR